MKKNSLKKEENIAVLLFLRFPGLLSENTARAFFIPHEARNVLNDAVDMRQHFLDELTDQRIALTGRIHLLINRNGGELPVGENKLQITGLQVVINHQAVDVRKNPFAAKG